MLKIENLNATYNEKHLLNNISLTLDTGQIAFLLGPNGAGKSSLARALMSYPGYEVTGKAILSDNDILSLPTHEKVKQAKIYYSHQTPVEFEGVNYLEYLRTIYNNSQPVENRLDTWTFLDKFNEVAKAVGIDSSFANRDLNEGFSGGEKKKSEILQMLLMSPRLVILDEIDSGLDIDISSKIYEIIKNTAREEKTTFLIITHNPGILKNIKPDKAFLLENGSLAKEGGAELAEQILNNGFNNKETN